MKLLLAILVFTHFLLLSPIDIALAKESSTPKNRFKGDSFSASASWESASNQKSKPAVSARVKPVTHILTKAGCFGLVEYSTGCLRVWADYEARCPNDFVPSPSTVYTYLSETNELLSAEFIPGYCPNETANPITLTQQDFQRLPLTPSDLNIAPENLSGYVNLPVFIHTTDHPQQLTTTILGTDILVEATPTTFTFNYGDNTAPNKTTEPGAPYPDQTNAHTYITPGTYTITLNTTWSGRFSTDNGTTWQTVPGTATTTTTSQPITIKQFTPLLTG